MPTLQPSFNAPENTSGSTEQTNGTATTEAPTPNATTSALNAALAAIHSIVPDELRTTATALADELETAYAHLADTLDRAVHTARLYERLVQNMVAPHFEDGDDLDDFMGLLDRRSGVERLLGALGNFESAAIVPGSDHPDAIAIADLHVGDLVKIRRLNSRFDGVVGRSYRFGVIPLRGENHEPLTIPIDDSDHITVVRTARVVSS